MLKPVLPASVRVLGLGVGAARADNRRRCLDIDPGEGAPSPSKLEKLRAVGGRS